MFNFKGCEYEIAFEVEDEVENSLNRRLKLNVDLTSKFEYKLTAVEDED